LTLLTPPLDCNVALYGTPTVAGGNDLVRISRGAQIASGKVTEAVLPLRSRTVIAGVALVTMATEPASAEPETAIPDGSAVALQA
jgi:hypothetical protein